MAQVAHDIVTLAENGNIESFAVVYLVCRDEAYSQRTVDGKPKRAGTDPPYRSADESKIGSPPEASAVVAQPQARPFFHAVDGLAEVSLSTQKLGLIQLDEAI